MVWWPFATKPERADTLEVIDLHSGAPLLYSTRFVVSKALFRRRVVAEGLWLEAKNQRAPISRW